MRGDFLEAVASRVVLSDGAVGTMLTEAETPGIPRGSLTPEELNLTEPDRVVSLHRAYIAAGAEVVQTNSFGTNAVRLAVTGPTSDADLLSRRAAELARQAAGPNVWVAGSMGPTGGFLEPVGDLTEKETLAAFETQASSLAEGGADLLLIETMSDPREAVLAVTAARRTGLPVGCTFSFDTHLRTLTGVSPRRAAGMVLEAGADLVGANCGDMPRFLVQAVEQIRASYPRVPLVAQPNAGPPHLQGGTTVVYEVSAKRLASYAGQFVAAGVRVVGSCCGSTPDYTAALAGALRAHSLAA
ncbi:MAG: hypothetical protein CL878_10365 [Dehalococcoidia bacterium]|nr:hypothetical protein [Dehalococcoidia bacterium]